MPCGWAGKARASTHAWICASMPSKLSSACGYLPSSAYLHAGAWLSGDRGAVHFQQPKRPQYHCPLRVGLGGEKRPRGTAHSRASLTCSGSATQNEDISSPSGRERGARTRAEGGPCSQLVS